jgi:hypothetical protein
VARSSAFGGLRKISDTIRPDSAIPADQDNGPPVRPGKLPRRVHGPASGGEGG